MSIAPALTTDHKKILQAKFTLIQEDEFYEITKNAKNKFEHKLKDGYVAGLKDHKKKSINNSFVIEYNCH
jgi:putative SOS response-associated peptidase YedK